MIFSAGLRMSGGSYPQRRSFSIFTSMKAEDSPIQWAVKEFALYIPDGGTAAAWGVAVTACGFVRTPPGSAVYPPDPGSHPSDHLFLLPKGGRILDGYQIVYVSAGAGRFESAKTGAVDIKAGSALLLFPDVWHRYAPRRATGWTEHFVELRGPALDRLRKEGILRPENAVFPVGSAPQVTEALGALHGLAREGGAGSRERMATLALHLLATILHARPSPALSDEERAVRQAEARMHEALGDRLQMADLAREAGLPYDRFRRCFKALTGLAPKQYYRQLQLRRAEDLLLHTERNLAGIAEELGFDSAFHFSAIFKEHAGQSPSLWRLFRRALADGAGDAPR
jgi:AraC-like DNA-binding protein